VVGDTTEAHVRFVRKVLAVNVEPSMLFPVRTDTQIPLIDTPVAFSYPEGSSVFQEKESS